ncbi:MAG TPA: cupin domain-containing protein [Gaiellaceae bacterium]|nr:cupin domain-containing protein [Gaiellaceae bacterium]
MGIAHWDEVEFNRAANGEIDASWQRLGATAGAVDVGVNRVRVAPGMLPTPPHSHGAAEEIYFVLDGSGLAWQDDAAHEVDAGTCVVQVADHFEHTFRAGPGGLEYLVFGTKHPTEFGWLPRSGAVRLGWPWVEGRTDDPWDIEAKAEPLVFADPTPRPPNIVSLEPGESYRRLGADAGAARTGLTWLRVAEGRLSGPPHTHSAAEEVFIVLEGEGTLELWPTPMAVEDGAGREDIPVRAGHVVARPASSGFAHAFRGGPGGLTLLAYGTNPANDICFYPRSNKILWGGIGVMARVEPVAYGDGEPDDWR